jgi:hypothetical protein
MPLMAAMNIRRMSVPAAATMMMKSFVGGVQSGKYDGIPMGTDLWE